MVLRWGESQGRAMGDQEPRRERPGRGPGACALRDGGGGRGVGRGEAQGRIDRTSRGFPAVFPFLAIDINSGRTTPIAAEPTYRTITGRMPYPFSPAAYSAAGGGHVWIGRSDTNQVRGYAGNGQLVTTITLPGPSQHVTQQQRRSYEEWQLASAASPAAMDARRRDQRDLVYPEQFPFFSDLKVDALGNLWVLRYQLPWSDADQVWDVFTSTGAPLAVATIPGEVLSPCRNLDIPVCPTVLEIGAESVLMLDMDVFPGGIPRIKRYGIAKDRSGAIQ